MIDVRATGLDPATVGLVARLVLGLAVAAVGAAVLRRGTRLGVAVGLVGVLLLAAATATAAGAPGWGDRLWAVAVFVVLPVALLLYPDSDAPGPGGRAVLALAVATGALALVAPADFRDTEITPVVLAALVVAGIWWRHEHAAERGRRAVLWLLLGLGTAVLTALLLSAVIAERNAAQAAIERTVTQLAEVVARYQPLPLGDLLPKPPEKR